MANLLLYFVMTTIFTWVWHINAQHSSQRKYVYAERAAAAAVSSFVTSTEDYTRAVERDLSEKVSARGPQPLSEDQLDNPLTRLVLLRRLSKEWPSLLAVVADNTGLTSVGRWLRHVRWPTESQANQAAKALMRTQITYGFTTDDLSNGFIFDKFVTNVTADDCFRVAKVCVQNDLYDNALEWLQKAVDKTNAGDRTLSYGLVLQYLLPSTCATGDTRRSKMLYMELLKHFSLPIIPPEDPAFIQKFIPSSGCETLSEYVKNFKDENFCFHKTRRQIQHHGRLCRGEGTAEADSRLRCRFVHHRQPHLRIQPFKLEELQLEPPVVRFLDVLTDLEAEALVKNISTPMQVARVNSPRGPVPSDIRSSEHAWIDEGSSPVHDRVARRVSEMTGLNTEGGAAENNQLARYGLSGEYLIHYDRISANIPLQYQRVATLMFYLNDVKRGGNTVFTTWNLSVRPLKNSAVFWFNQLRNGDIDTTSDHSGCPVLQGQKWVLTKWFRIGGNEFTTPCGLNEDDTFQGYFDL